MGCHRASKPTSSGTWFAYPAKRSGCCSEPLGDPSLLWWAATELDLSPDASEPAEKEGLIEIATRVAFRHPPLRSAIYRSAAPENRRAAHRALAAATDPEADPDRRAWHRAHAARAPDGDVVDELERSAGRARSREGLAAAAAFLTRATELTPDSRRRVQRALDAAFANVQTRAFKTARPLLTIAGDGP